MFMVSNYFKKLGGLWKKELREHKTRLVVGILLLSVSLYMSKTFSVYVDKVASVTAPDFFLNILPIWNSTFLMLWYPAIIAAIYLLYPLLVKPSKTAYIMVIVGVFYIVRSLTISMTHIHGPVESIDYPGMFTSDMFFSGHTGFPFLGFLIFSNKWIKAFMLFSSILMAITVMLGHQHYSIDVASAFFITYGIYKLGDWVYKKFSD